MIREIVQAVSRAARYVWRSAVTGRFVSKDYAKQNPDTTFKDKL